MKPLFVVLLAGALGACAYPIESVNQGAGRTALYVPKAPVGSALIVDGVSAGPASIYTGKKTAVLPVRPGRHRVVLTGPGRPLFDNDIYVGAGSTVAVEVSK